MPIYSTNWTETTTNATNWLGDRANEIATVGSPMGLLLSITHGASVDSLRGINSTDWDKTSSNSTNWGDDTVFTQGLVTEAGAGLVLESGVGLLIP